MRRSSSTPRRLSRKVRQSPTPISGSRSDERFTDCFPFNRDNKPQYVYTNASTECKNAPQCAPAKHHFDECVERVQQQESEGGAKEDCVEECMSTRAQLRHGSFGP